MLKLKKPDTLHYIKGGKCPVNKARIPVVKNWVFVVIPKNQERYPVLFHLFKDIIDKMK